MRSATPSINRHLVRELAFVLALKLVVLTALWWGFVHEQQVSVDGQAAASQLLGASHKSATTEE
ncbi:MAG: hypothetical protein CVU22_10020 [Betaproteobacteria bacterium HGW-Betaproteobacteria-16]|nr:MAG: hypothetical protein CVU22_10020 [Betaproteobacteria bacterium HGW-Betaproteobacteria-16]